MSYSTTPARGRKVLSHMSRVSSRPRTKILALCLALAISLSLSFALTHHDGGSVRSRREPLSSCTGAAAPTRRVVRQPLD